MRGFALILLFLTLTSCSPDPCYREDYPDIPALEQVVVSYSDEMERYDRLFLSDSRTFYDHYIEYVWMKFRTQANLDVYAGRDLMVHVVEGFLARVNEDPSVSEDLFNFPFTADNLIIEIEFDSFHSKYVDSRYLGKLHLQDGALHYYAWDTYDPDEILFHQRVEPYEKAYRFSKFKHYRPWVKRPVKPDYRIQDATEDPNAHHGKAAYSNVPRPAPKAQSTPSATQNLLQGATKASGPSTTGGSSTGGSSTGGSSGFTSSGGLSSSNQFSGSSSVGKASVGPF